MGQQQQRPPRIVEPPIPLNPFVAYMIGLALGSIPTILLLLAMGGVAANAAGTFVGLAFTVYFLSILAAIICLIFARTRYIGYGLLTMVFVTPVVWFIACSATCTGRYCH
jgi:hypothetical protein